MSDPIMNRLNARRELLMQRMEVALLAETVGEGTTTALELSLIKDEMAFLGTLYEVLLLIQIKQNLERV